MLVDSFSSELIHKHKATAFLFPVGPSLVHIFKLSSCKVYDICYHFVACNLTRYLSISEEINTSFVNTIGVILS